ncbi:hypothetical protein GFD25_00260 [Bifidobacterium aerophilum]|uniref:Uncharacterized protein n=1 Tax=Bifidobacterium aerophilum TaxID=1798155 RepID=A0A6N9Z1I2_9BIFI|nr:hypothetical protein [Bifidobacterium aerophilum]
MPAASVAVGAMHELRGRGPLGGNVAYESWLSVVWRAIAWRAIAWPVVAWCAAADMVQHRPIIPRQDSLALTRRGREHAFSRPRRRSITSFQ